MDVMEKFPSEKRLIDANAFLKDILTAGIGKTIVEYSESDIGYMIRKCTTVDAVEVVRCKDCKYYAAMVTDTVSGDMETATWGTCRQPWFNSYEYDVGEDGFCNCGAKMDKEEV